MLTPTPAQERAISDLHRSKVVTAGAGSGKTRVLVGRYLDILARNAADLDEIVAITFTEKAACEMRERLWGGILDLEKQAATVWEREKWRGIARRLPSARIGTIDSFCMQIVKEHPIEAGVDPGFEIMDEIDATILLTRCAREAVSDALRTSGPVSSLVGQLLLDIGHPGLVQELCSLVTQVRTIGAVPGAFNDEPCPGLAELVSSLDMRYRAALAEKSSLDFTGVELAARDILCDTEVGREIRERFKYVMVDEYQDTNGLQGEIIRGLVGEPILNRYFVVGDPKQSIYGFRGAQVKNFNEARDGLPREYGDVEELETNFRSCGDLIDVTNTVFSQVLAEQGFTPAQASRPVFNDVPRMELILLRPGEGRRSDEYRREAAAIASRISGMVGFGEPLVSSETDEPRPVEYRDIAVLVRAMSSSKEIESAFLAHGIPFYVVAGTGFYDRPEVEWMVSLLRAVDDENDEVSLASVLRSPLFGLSDDTLVRMAATADSFGEAMNHAAREEVLGLVGDEYVKYRYASSCINRLRRLKGWASATDLIAEALGPLGLESQLAMAEDGLQALGNIYKLMDLIQEHGASTPALPDVIDAIETARKMGARETEAAFYEESGNAVKIMTVHKSKGLEFPVVFIPDCSKDLPRRPSRLMFDPELGYAVRPRDKKDAEGKAREILARLNKAEDQEHARCLYVALTRARDYLVVSGLLPKRSISSKSWLDLVVSGLGLNPETVTASCEIAAGANGGKVRVRVLSPDEGQPSTDHAAETQVPSVEDCTYLPMVSTVRLSPTHRFSVSGLMCFAECERKYVYEYQHRLEPPIMATGSHGQEPSLSPRVRGYIVHSMYEKAGRDADLEKLLAQELERHGVEPSYRDSARLELLPLIIRALDMNWATPIGQTRGETPFIMRLGSYSLSGVIDRLMIEPDGTGKVVDIKTNRVEAGEVARLAEKYRVQMDAYALAAHRGFSLHHVTTCLHFLEPGRVETREYNEEELRSAEARILSIMDRATMVGSGYIPAELGAMCRACGYRPLCGIELEQGRTAGSEQPNYYIEEELDNWQTYAL